LGGCSDEQPFGFGGLDFSAASEWCAEAANAASGATNATTAAEATASTAVKLTL